MTEEVKDPREVDQDTQKPGGQQEPRTFTQEEVNGLVTKESRKALQRVLSDLGVEDVASAKEGLAKWKEMTEAQKSEAQKNAERLQELEGSLTGERESKRLLEAKFAAVSAGVNSDSVDDVIALAQRLTSDDVTIEQAIAQVVEKYPAFAQQTQPAQEKKPNISVPGNPDPQGQPEVSKEEFSKMTYAERVALKRAQPALYEQLTKG